MVHKRRPGLKTRPSHLHLHLLPLNGFEDGRCAAADGRADQRALLAAGDRTHSSASTGGSADDHGGFLPRPFRFFLLHARCRRRRRPAHRRRCGYGARRGNHEVMIRGTFANIRIRNEMLEGKEGGFTKYFPSGEIMSIYDAAMRYKNENIPLVVIAGKEYGTGSSRDWAAKGPKLQGVAVVVAESFERIHRSNLIGMGILPLEFMDGMTRKTLALTGSERIDILDLMGELKPRMPVRAVIYRDNRTTEEINLRSRIDTMNEIEYYKNGGILQHVLRSMLK